MIRLLRVPAVLGDGRVDMIVSALWALGDHEAPIEELVLDWQATTEVTPAGYAILAILIDVATEYRKGIRSVHSPAWLRRLPLFEFLRERNGRPPLLPAEKLTLYQPSLLSVRDGAIDPLFMEQVVEHYGTRLSDDLLFDVRLVVNELMQNSVDHAGAERYYMYAGLSDNELHVGILDMGQTIPARLERKYSAANDREFLEIAFRKGVGTRRTREGGLGLWYVYDVIQRNRGRLILISRGAQLRKYFQTRRSQIGILRYPLLGTWCMIRFPLRRAR